MDDVTTAVPPASTSKVQAYYELTKPGIAGYVMMTAGVSAYVAAGGALHPLLALNTVVGIGLATGGALSLNQYVERELDALMERTKGRPLPTGRLEPTEAVVFGSALLLLGILYMAVTLGTLPALLAAASALTYHGVYTPLKTRSPIATLAGAVPGALPMLIGWTAVTNDFDLNGGIMFAIGYFWQLPHVLGLAWMLREDYGRVGFKLIPTGGAGVIGPSMVLATLVLLPVSLLPTVTGMTGVAYGVGASVLGIAFLATAIRAARDLTRDSARRVFLASLLYHPILMAVMLLDTVGS